MWSSFMSHAESLHAHGASGPWGSWLRCLAVDPICTCSRGWVSPDVLTDAFPPPPQTISIDAVGCRVRNCTHIFASQPSLEANCSVQSTSQPLLQNTGVNVHGRDGRTGEAPRTQRLVGLPGFCGISLPLPRRLIDRMHLDCGPRKAHPGGSETGSGL